MISSTFNHTKVCGVATAVPTKWTPIEEYVAHFDPKNLERFKKSTGVLGRYDAADNQTASDL